MKTLLIVLLLIAVIVIIPLAGIWSVNTLFLTSIPYTLKTWVASFVLMAMFSSHPVSRSK